MVSEEVGPGVVRFDPRLGPPVTIRGRRYAWCVGAALQWASLRRDGTRDGTGWDGMGAHTDEGSEGVAWAEARLTIEVGRGFGASEEEVAEVALEDVDRAVGRGEGGGEGGVRVRELDCAHLPTDGRGGGGMGCDEIRSHEERSDQIRSDQGRSVRAK
jgi:hypothetical protein